MNALRENSEEYLAMTQREAAKWIGVGSTVLRKAFNKLKKELNLPDRWPRKRRVKA